MPMNPLFVFLRSFLSKRSLLEPDGRALYAYRCSDDEFSQIKLHLESNVPRRGPNRYVFINYSDVLFCLYASEYIRRYHVEGLPKWNGILDSVNWNNVPIHFCYNATTSGLRYWKRAIRKLGHGSGYLHTLACEGGLPIRMIENESGYLICYFRNVYSKVKTNHSIRQAFDIAKEFGRDIPTAMQNDLVYEVVGDFCYTLHALLNKQSGVGAASLKLMLENNPDWYKKLPLVLPKKSALDIVRKILTADDSGVVGTHLLRVERYWIENSDCWYCDAKFRIPKTLSTNQLAELFECKISSSQSRLILSAQWNNGGARLALLTKIEEQLWRVEALPAAEKPLTGAAALQDIIVTIHEGPCLLGQGIPKGGVALVEDMPWVFESINDKNTALRLVGCGSVNSTKSTLFVALPENSLIDLTGDGCFDIPQHINNSKRYLTKISGSFNVTLQDGAICRINIGQEVDVATEYYIKPTEFLNIKSNYPIHRAYPKVAWKSDFGFGLVPEQELLWRPVKLGRSSWFSMKDAIPKGQIEVRHIVGGLVCFSGRMVILPADFDIKFVPQNAQRGSIILDGIQHAKVERYQNSKNEVVKSDLFSATVEIHCDTDLSNSDNVDLRVQWSDGCYLKLLLPFPVGGGRFVGADGDVCYHGVTSVNELHGVVAEQLAINGNGSAFVKLVLKSGNLLSANHNMLYVDVPLVGGSVSSFKQLSLYEHLGLIKSILACASSLQDFIQVELYSDTPGLDSSKLKIQRYDYRFINDSGHLQLELASAITFPLKRLDNVVVKAVSLKNISGAAISLSKDVSGFDATSLPESDAPWLVFGCLDDAIRVQPLLLGPYQQNQENTPLLTAICSSGTEKCLSAICSALTSIQANPLQADFYELAHYMKVYKTNHDFPLLEIELFRELCNYPVVLVQLLIAAAVSNDFETVYDYQDELPFSWGWLPEPIWCEAFNNMRETLAEQMGNEDLAQQVMMPFLEQLIKVSHVDRRLTVVARTLASQLSASAMLLLSHNIPAVDNDLLRMAQQELVRLPDNFGHIGTFPKDVWLQVIPTSKHVALNRYWLKNRYDKRFEKLFNLMLVASLFCQSEMKLLSELSALFEIHYQQAPQQLGVVYQYYSEMTKGSI